jgi:hypothetical protein
MKKIAVFSIILFFAGLNVSLAQLAKVNPIPFYNYPLTEQVAAFQEKGNGETREKRDMDVVVTSSSDETTDIFATITLVKKNGSQTLGPFTVYCDDPFSIELPKGKWGVIVNCSWDVYVSVWIGDSQPPAKGLQSIISEQ